MNPKSVSELKNSIFDGDSVKDFRVVSLGSQSPSHSQLNEICLSQDFQYFVVIDFEATCDKEKIPDPQEIIEFPSVIVEGVTGDIVSWFQSYVRPTYNRQLTDFCKDLTGIQQNQVDEGITLSEALVCHDEWLENIGIKNNKFAVVTWSNWDCQVMLESECRYKKISKPSYFNQWINLRVPFHEVFGGFKCTLKQAVEIAGLPWTGRAHCGLDDAINTARLLSLLFRKGKRLSITNSLQPIPLYKPDKVEETLVYPRCFCGVTSKKKMMSPGKRSFFGCGNWTPSKGAHCKFFQFASI